MQLSENCINTSPIAMKLNTLSKNRIFFSALLSFCVAIALAMPAQRGVWRTATLTDGTSIRLQLQGDEHLHYWQSEDGRCFSIDDNGLAHLLTEPTRAKAQTRAKENNRRREARRLRLTSQRTPYTGHKKGLIILAEFSDRHFAAGHDKALFERMANQEGFTHQDGARGSIHDYFKAQSNEAFDLTFDVVGPVRLTHNMAYYGAETEDGDHDTRPGEMAAEACRAVQDSVDFSLYDWDQDGEVDQVYIIYAGYGQASGGLPSTIWPHEWTLSSSDYGSTLTLDHVTIDTYACSNELELGPRLAGIGTACHEFTHCLGFPDMYDTAGHGSFGMGSWDLMDYGGYNGRGYTPAGYTSYEKIESGWLHAVELKQDIDVPTLLPLSEGGGAFIIYNDNEPREYYLLENRRKSHWDSALPGEGLLVLHVDYDAAAWQHNRVNANPNHQRCTIFHADNSAGTTMASQAGDPYPFNDNDSLTATSQPRASVFNLGPDGSDVLNKSLTHIRRHPDGHVSFRFRLTSGGNLTIPGDTLFYESFDKCRGRGGNDGLWAGAAGSGAFHPDRLGWTSATSGNAEYGAHQCAKFGTTKTWGNERTPLFYAEDGATITFKAAAWGTENCTLNISSLNPRLTITPASFALSKKSWTTCTATLHGTGQLRLSFIGSQPRFFLDEVLVLRPTATGISEIPVEPTASEHDPSATCSQRIYSLDGRYLGTRLDLLGKGIYIVGGRKVVR